MPDLALPALHEPVRAEAAGAKRLVTCPVVVKQSARPAPISFINLALLMFIVLAGPACRTAARRLSSDPAPAIARLENGGTIKAEVDVLLQPLLESGDVFGAVVGIVTPDGQTQTFGYGRTGRMYDLDPPNGESLFQLGSVSKVFIAAALEKLVEEGRLSYQDTVREILPPEIKVTKEAGQLTLYDLATHTSGLPREPATRSQLISTFDYFFNGDNLYQHLDIPYIQWYLRHCHPKPKQPREYLYSNVGAGLLSYLMAVKTGRPATELVFDEICRPLGMSNSVFTLDAAQQARLAVGHVGNQACWRSRDHALKPWDMGDLMSPIAGMYSSVNDLLIFAQANLGMTGPSLQRALAATHQVRIETPRGAETLGWIINRFDDGRQTLTFKDGMVSGYCSYIGLDLDAHVAVVVLRNSFNWDETIGHNLLRRLGGYYRARQSGLSAR